MLCFKSLLTHLHSFQCPPHGKGLPFKFIFSLLDLSIIKLLRKDEVLMLWTFLSFLPHPHLYFSSFFSLLSKSWPSSIKNTPIRLFLMVYFLPSSEFGLTKLRNQPGKDRVLLGCQRKRRGGGC